MSEDWGIKLSKDGFNVVDAADADLGVSSEFPMFKIYEQGTFSLRLGVTQLNGAISSSATTITVDSTDNFRSNGGYFWIADSFGIYECIEYSGTTSTTFTGCVRGFKSTTAAAHADNATVYAGQDERRVSHGLSYPPVHFVFDSYSNNNAMCPRFLDGFGVNYIDAYVTSSLFHVSVELVDANTAPTVLPTAPYDEYDFSYILMGDSITTPYY